MLGKNSKPQKWMETSMLRIALKGVLIDPERLKIVAALNRVSYIHYNDKKAREKKLNCSQCKTTFDNVLLLMLHFQLQHSEIRQKGSPVEKFQIETDTLWIHQCKLSDRRPQKSSDFLTQISSSECYIFGSLKYRVNTILTSILNKVCRKHQPIGETTYFHSADIYRLIGTESENEDSENDLGTVQRQLEQLRIRDFTDVNDNDKRFFIEWNEYMHEQKRQHQLFYPGHMRSVLVGFAEHLAEKANINIRLNLVMHLWSLWSLGQIGSDQMIPVLVRYDQVKASKEIPDDNRKSK